MKFHVSEREREQIRERVERWVRAYPIGRVLKAMINNLGERDGLVGEGSTVNSEDMLGAGSPPCER